jgi:hypothetical protein
MGGATPNMAASGLVTQLGTLPYPCGGEMVRCWLPSTERALTAFEPTPGSPNEFPSLKCKQPPGWAAAKSKQNC